MKRLIPVIIVLSVVASACGKKKVAKVDPRFIGRWECESSLYYELFIDPESKATYYEYPNKEDLEPDLTKLGTAKLADDRLYIGRLRLRVDEYPMQFDTMVVDTTATPPDTAKESWRMTLNSCRFYKHLY